MVESDDTPETEKWRKVFNDELEALIGEGSDREIKKEELRKKVVGIAFSGGGIRSASFALGVFQALLAFDVTSRFHYLSTVSGGGYLGVAVAWLRRQYGADWKQQFSSKEGTRRKKSETEPSTATTSQDETKHNPQTRVQGEGESSPLEARVWLDYIRQHSNYLQPPHMGAASLAGVALRNVALSVGVYVALSALFFHSLSVFGFFDADGSCYILQAPSPIDPAFCSDARSLAYAVCLVLVFTFVIYSLGSYVISLKGVRELIAALAFTSIALIAVFIGLRTDITDHLCPGGCPEIPNRWSSSLLISGVLVVTMIVVYFGFRRFSSATTKSESIDSEQGLYKLRIWLQQMGGWATVLLVALTGAAQLHKVGTWVIEGKHKELLLLPASAVVGALFYATVRTRGIGSKQLLAKLSLIVVFAGVVFTGAVGSYFLAQQFERLTWPGLAIVAAFILLVAFCTNLNQFGIGRMYRDRLMEAFMPDKESVAKTQWMPAYEANKADGLLANLWECGSEVPSLYPLINANVVLMDSRQDLYRGRGGDSFVLTPKYCGSNATGWVETKKFADGALKAGTAMAISGAAANPNAALGGHGFARNRLAAFLMFVAQARLGAWVVNPMYSRKNAWGKFKAWSLGQRPNFLFPGIRSGLFGRGLHENGYFLELTDGGHFDNTGAYELIRRRAKLIVLVQASQDSDFSFGDLANLSQKIRVDFGARLTFRDGMSLGKVVPIDGEGVRTRLALRGHAIARIDYGQDGEKGWLVYLQATPLERLPVDVHSYYRHNKEFPNEPTANQFFREAQLEAYRELGYAVAKRFLLDVACTHTSPVGCHCGPIEKDEHDTAESCLREIHQLLQPSTNLDLRGREPRLGPLNGISLDGASLRQDFSA